MQRTWSGGSLVVLGILTLLFTERTTLILTQQSWQIYKGEGTPKVLYLLCKHTGLKQPCKAFLRKTVSTIFTGGRDWDSTFPSPPLEGCIQCRTCNCSNRAFFPNSSNCSWLGKVHTSNSYRVQDFSSGSGSLHYRLRCHHMDNPVPSSSGGPCPHSCSESSFGTGPHLPGCVTMSSLPICMVWVSQQQSCAFP